MTKIELALRQRGRLVRIRRHQMLQTPDAMNAGLSVEVVVAIDRHHQLIECGVRIEAKNPSANMAREAYFDHGELPEFYRSVQLVFEVMTEQPSGPAEQLPIRYVHSDVAAFHAPGTRPVDPVMLVLGDERPRRKLHPVEIRLDGGALDDLRQAIQRSLRSIEQIRENSK
jgi:hypothetical protein